MEERHRLIDTKLNTAEAILRKLGPIFIRNHLITQKGVIPGLPRRTESGEEQAPQQQSEIDVGDLTAITGHGPTLLAGATSIIGLEVVQPHTIIVSPTRRTRLLSHPRIHGAPG
ncbi:hypothetical protein AVEN_76151-1 [Araneus ventricosus]|uniref:Uncharacterized protein n=1 Tax=Araneus ventricosus TaxID=182803 RepID=A0A4Y2E5K8_ARAVE|nr:hypothetical protein AVEN_76151-1 [Araneus ventricosus]